MNLKTRIYKTVGSGLALSVVLVGAWACGQLRVPRVRLTADKIEINEKIQFETGKATILPVSHSLLDELAQVFRDNPQIQLVQVEGHTDSVGSPAKNLTLSRQRAQAVMDYLIGHGVAASRLRAAGFGQQRPLADNDSEEGRAANRRVEFNIVKQSPRGYRTTVE